MELLTREQSNKKGKWGRRKKGGKGIKQKRRGNKGDGEGKEYSIYKILFCIGTCPALFNKSCKLTLKKARKIFGVHGPPAGFSELLASQILPALIFPSCQPVDLSSVPPC